MRLAEAENESSDDATASVADSTEGSSLSGTNTDSDINVTEERFRVDRRKLEQMLEANSSRESDVETADKFFHRIMEETMTTITWPTKLKVGAKSKKDPHIKISGAPEAVQSAREKILANLDTKRNRVTLKMDVSFTDHSHIIGKAGKNIQAVMEETGCHIHFPDSNRNAVGEKSNQVSIAGQPDGVERARIRIRELLPMVVSFDVPMPNFLTFGPDMSSPALQLLQQTYNFVVVIKPKQMSNGCSMATVVVRSGRRLIGQLRAGLGVLMGYLTGNQGTVLPVSMSLEIPPQHHSFVIGHGNVNVQNIMTDTGANIIFPDPTAIAAAQSTGHNTLINGLRKSTVVISGHFDSVYLAWQQLMSCLPLVLLFDLQEGHELDTTLVTGIMDELDLNIVIRPKPKQNTKSILVRGFERSSALLFQVRKDLLEREQSEMPMTYNPNPPSFIRNRPRPEDRPVEEKPLSASLLKELVAFSHGNPLVMNGASAAPTLPTSAQPPPPALPNNPLLPWIVSQLSANPFGFYGALMQAQMVAAQQQQMTEFTAMEMITKAFRDMSRGPSPTDPAGYKSSSSSHASSLSSPSDSPCESPVFMSSDGYGLSSGYGGSTSSLSSNPDSKSDSRMTSNWNSSFWLGDNPDYSDVMSNQSPYDQTENQILDAKPSGRPITSVNYSNQTSQGSAVNDQFKPIGSERRANTNGLESDYIQNRLLASKAMKESDLVNGDSGPRIPTDIWSGYGFSRSMPQQLLRSKFEQGGVIPKRSETLPEVESGATCARNSWSQAGDFPENGSMLSTSNRYESGLPRPSLGLNGGIQDLAHLLTLISLDKYFPLFRAQQVDLATFLTLDEKDLHELGIQICARRKMLLAITELNCESDSVTSSKAFHVAPGAERRAMFARQAPAQSNSTHRPAW